MGQIVDELARLSLDRELTSALSVVQLNVHRNDVPCMLPGAPTLTLFRAGNKDVPIHYAGSETLADVAHFIWERGRHKADMRAAVKRSSMSLFVDQVDHPRRAHDELLIFSDSHLKYHGYHVFKARIYCNMDQYASNGRGVDDIKQIHVGCSRAYGEPEGSLKNLRQEGGRAAVCSMCIVMNAACDGIT